MSEKIGEAVDEFGQMDVSQVTFNKFRVTSWRNDTTTSHLVNLSTGSCTCEDQTMNNQGEEACAHILKANHVAESRPDTSQHLMRFVSDEAQAVRDAAESIEQTATSIEAYQQSGGSQTASQPADDDGSDDRGDPVEQFKALMRDAGLDPDNYEMWIDDQYGSLQFEQDGYLDDDEFRKLQDFKDDVGAQWDPDGEVNYLKADDFEGVLW